MIGPGVGITSLAVLGGGGVPPPWKRVQSILAAGGYTAYGQFDPTNFASLSLVSGMAQSIACLITGTTLAAPSSAARPAYNATGGANGTPVLVADGNDDVLSADSVPWPSGAAACEMWFACSQVFNAADTAIRVGFSYGSFSGSSSNSRVLRREVVSAVNRARAIVGTGSAVSFGGTTVDLTGFHVIRLRIDGTDAAISVDGNTPTTAARVPATATLRTALFGQLSLASGFWGGAMSCALITPLLDNTTAANLLAHFQTR